MQQALIPFERAQLPADLADLFGSLGDDDLSGGVGAGFPSISIKGKVFHLVRGGERTLIENPKEPGEPAASLEVVILRANPILSKLYYATGYVEGAADKPTCYSDDNVAPAADAEAPQAQKCATCPHAVWGSKITEDGKKAKECQDSRRIAVAPLGNLEDAMLLRVPATSLKPLKTYGDEVKKRGLKYFAVGTRISFDHTVSHPLLVLRPLGVLPEAMLRKVAEVMTSDLVASILGISSAPMQDEFSTPMATYTQPASKPAPTAKPAAKPEPAVSNAAQEVATPPPAPKPAAKAAPKPAAAKPPVRFAPVVVETMEDLDSQLDAMLSAAGFEDVEDGSSDD